MVGIVVKEGTVAVPEWLHGRSGRSMGETGQLWSAAGLLYAMECAESGSTGAFAELSA